MHLTVTALKDPFQHAAIFAIAWPKEFASLVLAKPVNVKNLRQLGRAGERSHLEPMRKVIAHVVAAKRKHSHGITA